MKRSTLTDRQIRQIKETGIYVDGQGLRLRVSGGQNGAALRKSWLLRATGPTGRKFDLGLGSASKVSLAEVRAEAERLRELVRQGIDPISHRRAEMEALRSEEARQVTFKTVALEYIASRRPSWSNEKHAEQWTATLESYAFPVLGQITVSEVDQDHVLRVLQPIWYTKTETASRVRGRIEAILDYAKVKGARDGDNPAAWRGHLQRVLPAPTSVQKPKHHAAVPFRELPSIYRSIAADSTSIASDCLRFLILTGVRYAAAAGARWEEIDEDLGCWSVPSIRGKGGKGHRVPLSSEALNLLQARRAKSVSVPHSGLIFPSPLGDATKLSGTSLTAALRRAGRAETVHGFRSTFRDWISETTDFTHEVAEAALAHTITNKTEAAYRRGDLFAKRVAVMQAWGNYCAGQTNER